MKNEKQTSADTTQNNDDQKDEAKKSTGFVTDTTPATEKARSKPGHGLANEGTNVNYEEQRWTASYNQIMEKENKDQQRDNELQDKAVAKATGDKDMIPPVANLVTDSVQRTAKQEEGLNEAATDKNDLEPGTASGE